MTAALTGAGVGAGAGATVTAIGAGLGVGLGAATTTAAAAAGTAGSGAGTAAGVSILTFSTLSVNFKVVDLVSATLKSVGLAVSDGRAVAFPVLALMAACISAWYACSFWKEVNFFAGTAASAGGVCRKEEWKKKVMMMEGKKV